MQNVDSSQVPQAVPVGSVPSGDASNRNAITNAVAAVVAIAGAVVASPSAMEKLPAAIGSVLKTTATLGNTTQPLVVTVVGIVIAAITHPPSWLTGAISGVRKRVHL